VEETLGISVEDIKNYTFIETEYQGSPLLLSRTGYTGEDALRLYFPQRSGRTALG